MMGRGQRATIIMLGWVSLPFPGHMDPEGRVTHRVSEGRHIITSPLRFRAAERKSVAIPKEKGKRMRQVWRVMSYQVDGTTSLGNCIESGIVCCVVFCATQERSGDGDSGETVSMRGSHSIFLVRYRLLVQKFKYRSSEAARNQVPKLRTIFPKLFPRIFAKQ